MKNFRKKAAAGICAVAMLAVSAASTGLTAFAANHYYHDPEVDPETGWKYQLYDDDQGNPSWVQLYYLTESHENLIIPSTFQGVPVKSIMQGAVNGHNELKTADVQAASIWNASKNIPACMFEECHCLQSVKISVPIDYIGYNAFRKCYDLEKINLPNGLKEIESGAFYSCTSLEHIDFPSTLQKIHYDAFRNCTSLYDVYIPFSVTEIGDYAFGNTNLTRVVVYNPNTNIANSAFPANVKQFCAPAEATNLQTYAESHGIPYLPFSLGNVNHDDRIDTKDVNMVLRAYTYEISGLDSGLSEVQKLEADINGNGKIDVRDSRLLLKYYTEVVVLHGDMSLPDYLLTQN